MKSIQKQLRQLLQTVPAVKMLQVPLYLDAIFEHFNQNADKPSLKIDASQNVALHRPYSIIKAMDCLLGWLSQNRSFHRKMARRAKA